MSAQWRDFPAAYTDEWADEFPEDFDLDFDPPQPRGVIHFDPGARNREHIKQEVQKFIAGKPSALDVQGTSVGVDREGKVFLNFERDKVKVYVNVDAGKAVELLNKAIKHSVDAFLSTLNYGDGEPALTGGLSALRL